MTPTQQQPEEQVLTDLQTIHDEFLENDTALNQAIDSFQTRLGLAPPTLRPLYQAARAYKETINKLPASRQHVKNRLDESERLIRSSSERANQAEARERDQGVQIKNLNMQAASPQQRNGQKPQPSSAKEAEALIQEMLHGSQKTNSNIQNILLERIRSLEANQKKTPCKTPSDCSEQEKEIERLRKNEEKYAKIIEDLLEENARLKSSAQNKAQPSEIVEYETLIEEMQREARENVHKYEALAREADKLRDSCGCVTSNQTRTPGRVDCSEYIQLIEEIELGAEEIVGRFEIIAQEADRLRASGDGLYRRLQLASAQVPISNCPTRNQSRQTGTDAQHPPTGNQSTQTRADTHAPPARDQSSQTDSNGLEETIADLVNKIDRQRGLLKECNDARQVLQQQIEEDQQPIESNNNGPQESSNSSGETIQKLQITITILQTRLRETVSDLLESRDGAENLQTRLEMALEDNEELEAKLVEQIYDDDDEPRARGDGRLATMGYETFRGLANMVNDVHATLTDPASESIAVEPILELRREVRRARPQIQEANHPEHILEGFDDLEASIRRLHVAVTEAIRDDAVAVRRETFPPLATAVLQNFTQFVNDLEDRDDEMNNLSSSNGAPGQIRFLMMKLDEQQRLAADRQRLIGDLQQLIEDIRRGGRAYEGALEDEVSRIRERRQALLVEEAVLRRERASAATQTDQDEPERDQSGHDDGDCQENLRKAMEDLRTLQAELSIAEAEIDRLRMINDSIRDEQRAEIESLQARVEELLWRIDNQNGNGNANGGDGNENDYDEQLRQARQQLEDIEEELGNVQDENGQMQEEIDRLRERNDELQGGNARLQRQSHDDQAEIDSLNAVLAEQLESVRNLRHQVDDLIDGDDDARDEEIQSLRNQLKQIQEDLDVQTTALEECERKRKAAETAEEGEPPRKKRAKRKTATQRTAATGPRKRRIDPAIQQTRDWKANGFTGSRFSRAYVISDLIYGPGTISEPSEGGSKKNSPTM